MNLVRILSAALTGTTAMTLTSYAVSAKKNREFREPKLLAMLLKRLAPTLDKENARISGWIMHYAVGVLFATIYDQLWSKEKIRPTLANGALLGGINGVVGAAVWKSTFHFHPNPPVNSRERFYAHLIVAHIVFGAASEIGYRLVSETKPKTSGTNTVPEGRLAYQANSILN
jgi:hypothetical protein